MCSGYKDLKHHETGTQKLDLLHSHSGPGFKLNKNLKLVVNYLLQTNDTAKCSRQDTRREYMHH
jgi:hypothetical protein